VAFSGGVDSTFLAKFAHLRLGERLLLVHLRSALVPERESRFAETWAKAEGIRLVVLELDPLSDPEVRANGPRRCYFCKRRLMAEVIRVAAAQGIRDVADATNTDDFFDYRPGLEATAELGILHPLSDAGMGKREIRAAARRLGLPNAGAAAAACLASRIPCNTPLDETVLTRVAKAEDYLAEEGFLGCRVRAIGPLAVIESKPSMIRRMSVKAPAIASTLRSFGFKRVCLDLAGYRQGSMNLE
jgi:uncharacterized protein